MSESGGFLSANSMAVIANDQMSALQSYMCDGLFSLRMTSGATTFASQIFLKVKNILQYGVPMNV